MMAHSQHNADPTYHVKETQLNTIERYYIYAELYENNHLNDEHTISPNKDLICPSKTPQAINHETFNTTLPHRNNPGLSMNSHHLPSTPTQTAPPNK